MGEPPTGHLPAMRTATLASILTLLTSTISACGSDSQQTGSSASSDASTDAASDASSADSGVADTGTYVDSGCGPGGLPDGDGGCLPPTIRRPFLVGSSLRSARATRRADWSSTTLIDSKLALDPFTRRRLAEVWLADALEEHASVAAFARFTMLMLSVGAPPDLIVRSQRASIDEVRHAEKCFGLASRYGAESRGPSALVVHDSMRAMSLAEIAELTAEEGCVGETLGALLACEQRDRAIDPEAKRVLTMLANDEQRHSALAWAFTRWAVLRGGDDVRKAVKNACDRAITKTLAMEIRAYDDLDLEAWHAHGRVTCAEARAVAAHGIEALVRPCLAQTLS
jgi:hypothetical protein